MLHLPEPATAEHQSLNSENRHKDDQVRAPIVSRVLLDFRRLSQTLAAFLVKGCVDELRGIRVLRPHAQHRELVLCVQKAIVFLQQLTQILTGIKSESIVSEIERG